VADVDVELPVDRPAGDLGLVLVFDLVRHDRAAAITVIGQRGLQDLVDLRGDGAARPRAVVLAALAAGPLGIGLGRPLGERRRLSFAGPRRLVQPGLKRGDACLQVGDPPIALSTPGAPKWVRIGQLHIHVMKA
jgi:hypothetical protein